MSSLRGAAAVLLLAAAMPSAAADAGIDWIAIPGGSFDMGSQPVAWTYADTGRVIPPEETAKERPVHRVTVKPFEMAKSPVTFKQYRACVEAGACTPCACEDRRFIGDDQPVVGVDWYQAKAFSEWAGGRLPSEAEWEYAARSAGKDRPFPWGDEVATCERAVMVGPDGALSCGRGVPGDVCSKPKGNTDQGLCDMAGLVWQWTQDWYHDTYEGAPRDGSAWETPATFDRVARGGSYDNHFMVLRASSRGVGDPNFRGCVTASRKLHGLQAVFDYFGLLKVPEERSDIGFRPVRAPSAGKP